MYYLQKQAISVLPVCSNKAERRATLSEHRTNFMVKLKNYFEKNLSLKIHHIIQGLAGCFCETDSQVYVNLSLGECACVVSARKQGFNVSLTSAHVFASKC